MGSSHCCRDTGQSEISHRLGTGQWLRRQLSQPSVLAALCLYLTSTELPRTGTSLINCSEFSPGWFGLEWCLRCLGWLGWTRDSFGRRTLRSHPIPIGRCSRKWFQALHSAAWFDNKRLQVERGEVQGSGFGLDMNRDFFPMKTSKQVVHPPGQCIPPPSWGSFKTKLGRVLRCLVWPWSCPYF